MTKGVTVEKIKKAKLVLKARASTPAPTSATQPKTTAKPAKKSKAVALKPAPMQRKPTANDRTYTVNLLPRHADWVEMRARQNNRTPEQMLEKIVREGYAMDPNNKTGASTNDASQVGALAEQKQQANG